MRSLCLLTDVVSACETKGGVGGSARIDAGDESSTIGSALVFPAFSECIRILDGRLMGDSAAVRRRLRSPELREDDESVRSEGRFGSVYREEEGVDRASEVAAGSGGGCWLTGSVPSSRKKSIHVSRSCARKCDATTPCEWCLELLPMTASLAPSALLFAPPDELPYPYVLWVNGPLGRGGFMFAFGAMSKWDTRSKAGLAEVEVIRRSWMRE
jgi:hypothetical protein